MINKVIIGVSVMYIISLISLLGIAQLVSAEIVTDPNWDFAGKIFLMINFITGTMAALLNLVR